ncbi:MAG: GNAT family N-acetyltransferase, partial [Butyricimonas faecihominis]
MFLLLINSYLPNNEESGPYGVIFDLSVDPAYRGKRIGQELLQKATESF